MADSLDLDLARGFVTALLIGALVGIEREKRKAEEGPGAIAGLRTFILFAELGAIAGWMALKFSAPWLVAAMLAVAALPVVAGYVASARNAPDSVGLTTEVALLVVCGLGAMTMLGEPALAIGLAVVTAATLAYKQPLHGLVARLGWEDVYAGVRLLIATFIVLPLLPDRPVDPWGALNPYKLWLLVILISSLSLVGYVATRWLGSHKGIALTAISGGLVSSTAVTLSFARKAQLGRSAAPMLAAGILLAWMVMFARVVVAVLIVNPALLPALLVPMAAMGAAAGAAAAVLMLRRAPTGGQRTDTEELQLRNPFSLTAAVKFAAFFAAVLLIVKLVEDEVPGLGTYIVAGLAGLTDVDAITLSMAQSALQGGSRQVAATAIIIATISNTLVKCGMVAALGGGHLARPVAIATAAVVLAGAVGQGISAAFGL